MGFDLRAERGVFRLRGGVLAILATALIRGVIVTVEAEIRTPEGQIIEHSVKDAPFGNSRNRRSEYVIHC